MIKQILPQEELDAMAQAQEEIWKEEKEQQRKDQAVLDSIKLQVSEKLFKLIQKEIKDCDNSYGFEIIDERKGDDQERKDEINIWIDQWSVGMEGDSFAGNCYVKLPSGNYLKWSYDC